MTSIAVLYLQYLLARGYASNVLRPGTASALECYMRLHNTVIKQLLICFCSTQLFLPCCRVVRFTVHARSTLPYPYWFQAQADRHWVQA